MSALRKLDRVSEEDYLNDPAFAEWPHEFLDGRVLAMEDATPRHEVIAGNLFAALRERLKNQRCCAFQGRMRLRFEYLNRTIFYVPDVMVACDPPSDKSYQAQPLVLVEVLSPSTEHIDIREKMFAYLTLPPLTHYIIAAQERQELTVYRRTTDGWEIETLTDSADELRIPHLDFSVSMNAVYQDAGLELS